MTLLSCLRYCASSFKPFSKNNSLCIVARQMSGGPRKMHITPSKWQWEKFKDMFHFYFMVGAIPVGLVIIYSNFYIGPSQLTPIPEGYTPERWEYYKHPITRCMAKYIYPSYQQDYEKLLHYKYEEDEKRKMRLLEMKVKKVIARRQDTRAYQYRPPSRQGIDDVREESRQQKEIDGWM